MNERGMEALVEYRKKILTGEIIPKKRLVGSGNAVKNECRECFGFRWKSCLSMICKLNDKTISVRRRIRLHCLDCVGTSPEVEKCTGKLLFEKRLCFLHPFRFRKEKIEKANKETSTLYIFQVKEKI